MSAVACGYDMQVFSEIVAYCSELDLWTEGNDTLAPQREEVSCI
jgi:hypothetical protein